MSSVIISGDTSGAITLNAPAVAGTTSLNLPATTGTMLNDATCGVCRAWVNFTMSGTTPTIQASFNVTSITYNSAGNYTATFTNALTDNKYAATGICGYPGVVEEPASGGTRTTIAYQFYTVLTSNGSPTTYTNISLMIFR